MIYKILTKIYAIIVCIIIAIMMLIVDIIMFPFIFIVELILIIKDIFSDIIEYDYNVCINCIIAEVNSIKRIYNEILNDLDYQN